MKQSQTVSISISDQWSLSGMKKRRNHNWDGRAKYLFPTVQRYDITAQTGWLSPGRLG